MFGHFFDHEREKPALHAAIERAIDNVEPLIKLTHGYHANYQKPVATALEYAHTLAHSVPGPVAIDRASYASDAFVHALFPSADAVTDAFSASRALHDYYLKFPDTDVLYALMGMRRFEKNTTGMELAGEVIQRDVVQKTIYFTSHTLENPAPTEKQSREQVALSFFDSLVSKVKQRIAARKRDMQSQLQDENQLMSRLRTADAQSRPALEAQLSELVSRMQSAAGELNPGNYIDDFEAVLLHPEQHLKLRQTPIIMDNMGIIRSNTDANQETILFNELVDYDRRDWTVTMVCCSNMKSESFSTRLTEAYRRLAI
jgi:hypothetical protein